MPELPEVQTTVNGLRKTVVGLTIQDAWTDLAKKTVSRPDHTDSIKHLPFFESFRKVVQGAKIVSVERRAKNILMHLDTKKSILIHMKMTGHMMYGAYAHDTKTNVWAPSKDEKNDALRDPFNKFLRFVLTFTNGKQLVLSDMRKFAKVTFLSDKHVEHLGPEPLEKAFTYARFKERLSKKRSGKIKTVLMDQTVISGVGNIYSDEALWLAGIQPESAIAKIPENKIKELYGAVQAVLKKGIDFGGDSTSDYRRIDGTRGKFSAEHNAYRLTGKPCKKPRCKGAILRKVVGGRSAHFCPVHQRLYA
jgi:formamidopyrimidine-DNA glycosylase